MPPLFTPSDTTDGIGTMKRLGARDTQDLCCYGLAALKRVRLLRWADPLFALFCLDIERNEVAEPTGRTIGRPWLDG
jgi:putative transposase